MANISDKVAQIREATYGKEVRESIASGIEDINTEVESTTQRQTTLETDMADAKREAEEAAVRANTAAGDAEDITEALAVWEDYDPDADYIPMNKVVYQGSCYINIVACKGVLPTNQTNWLKIASKGLKGNTGAVPDISIGTVTTVAAGTSASVTRRAGSTDESPILDFDIPKGYDGEGAGDMTKFDYDSNNDGKVDAADIADSVPDNTITDAKLSDTAGQIKARFTSHLADNVTDVDGAHGLKIEVGTFTPELKFGGNNVGLTYTIRIGYFVRIGDFVHVECSITLSNKGSSVGDARVSGFPFASLTTNPGGMLGPVRTDYMNLPVNMVNLTFALQGADGLLVASINNANRTLLNDTHFSNNTQINLNGDYRR